MRMLHSQYHFSAEADKLIGPNRNVRHHVLTFQVKNKVEYINVLVQHVKSIYH